MSEQFDVVKTLVDTENSLKRAKNICVTSRISDELELSLENVTKIGDHMFPQIIQEARKKYQEASS